MKTSSAKAKGRRLQQHVRDTLIETFGLHEDDVLSRSMGASGEDLHLSPAARSHFPFSVECKNQERLSIWKALEQAEENAGEGSYPAVVFKRNRSKVYVAMELDDLLELMKGA